MKKEFDIIMANPLRKVTDLFKKLTNSETSKGWGRTYPNKSSMLYEQMMVEQDRKKIYQECWVMYSEDARISAAIDTTAGSATNGGFTLKFNNVKENNESVIKDSEEIINTIIKKTKLLSIIPSVAKELLILGDVFLEVILDFDQNEIVKLKKLPARTIERIEDEFGELEGFVQKDDMGNIIAEFEPWQILHMRWNNFTGQRYGTSMIRGVRLVYKKLKMTEEDLVVRRRTRAGLKLHHYGADETEPLEPEEVDEYIQLNQSNPMNVRTDFYSNGKWKIEVLKSDDGVNEIEDVKHLEDTMFVGLRTPKGILGLSSDSNRSTIERQEVSYIRLLNEITEVISEQITSVFDIGLNIKGINPETVDYDLIWKEKTIEDMNRKIERLILQSNGGFVSKQTATEEMGYNFEDEMERIQQEQKEYDFIDFNDTKFVDPKSTMQSNREKVKHQKRTDDGKENQKTTFDGDK
jgi:hypothetical protein